MSHTLTPQLVDEDKRTSQALQVLILCMIIALLSGIYVLLFDNSMQVFAKNGFIKRLTLPLIYLAFGTAFLTRSRTLLDKPTRRLIYFLTLTVSVSAAISALDPSVHWSFLNSAQSVALALGMLLTMGLGATAVQWSERNILIFTFAVGVLGVISIFTSISTTPFDVVRIPTAFMLIYVGWHFRRRALFSMLMPIGFLMLTINFLNLHNDKEASIAVIAQFIACSAIFTIRIVPAFLRGILLFTLGIGAATTVVITGIWRILFGMTMPDWDVTLLHRAYETRQVRGLIEGPWEYLWGAGPGSTVDLSASPDALTLAASGRDLLHVDDVHLLTSWLFMKFGVLGLIWLFVFLTILGRGAWRVIQSPPGFSVHFVFLMFVFSGVLAALPAATNFFANPLMAFCAGAILLVKPTTRRPDSNRVALPSLAVRS